MKAVLQANYMVNGVVTPGVADKSFIQQYTEELDEICDELRILNLSVFSQARAFQSLKSPPCKNSDPAKIIGMPGAVRAIAELKIAIFLEFVLCVF